MARRGRWKLDREPHDGRQQLARAQHMLVSRAVLKNLEAVPRQQSPEGGSANIATRVVLDER